MLDGYNQIAIMDYLLSQKVDINRPNVKGVTSLFLAAQLRAPKVVNYLIGKGADPNIKD